MSYQVSESAVRRLFSNMGFVIQGIDSQRLERKLSQLQQHVKEGDPLTETDDLNLRDELLERLGRGEKLEILPESCTVVIDESCTSTGVELPTGQPVANGSANEDAQQAKNGKKPGRKPSQAAQKSTKTQAQGENEATGAAKVAKRGGKPSGALILGFSACKVAHWMGYNQFSTKEAQAVLNHFHVDMNPSSLRTYLTDGRRKDEKFVKKDLLNDEQAAQLFSIKQATPKEETAEVATA